MKKNNVVNLLAGKAVMFILLLLSISSQSFAGNYIDSDLSNTAESNLGKDHAEIYYFIIFLLILSVIAAFLEQRATSKNK